ncbi:MAG: hypothetical protein ACREGA_00790 [Candidatus Saccharimonadales bacterium]
MKPKDNYDFVSKWTSAIARSGHTAIPNLLIEKQAQLGITNGELAVLLGLLRHKWTSSDPYPAVSTLSGYSGMASQTIRKHLRSLEAKDIIKRKYRKASSSEYDFSPLTKRLESYAQAKPPPAQKRTPRYTSMSRRGYSKTSTKEKAVENIKRRKPFYQSEPVAIGNLLANRYGGMR